MNIYDTIVITLYTLGLIFWLVMWYITDSFTLVTKNKLIYFPLLLIPIVFILETLFFYGNRLLEPSKRRKHWS